MTRSCPHSDMICPYGMSCQYSCATDQYNGDKHLVPVGDYLRPIDDFARSGVDILAMVPWALGNEVPMVIRRGPNNDQWLMKVNNEWVRLLHSVEPSVYLPMPAAAMVLR